jgi:hypothetical protein
MILAGARAAVLGFRQTCYMYYAMFAGLDVLYIM